MNDELALLAAIRAHLDDDTPRLVYADFLDEHDEPEKAEYLRLTIELLNLCASVDTVLQTLILKDRLGRLQELKAKLPREWLAVVNRKPFDSLYMNERDRAAFWQADQEEKRREMVRVQNQKQAEQQEIARERREAEQQRRKEQEVRESEAWNKKRYEEQQEQAAAQAFRENVWWGVGIAAALVVLVTVGCLAYHFHEVRVAIGIFVVCFILAVLGVVTGATK